MPEQLPIVVPDMAPRPPSPQSLQDIARAKIKHWIASTGITQTQICEQIGRNQPWLSRYLAGGIDADVDTLAKMARVFEQNLFALLSIPADPDEAAVLRMYRALRPNGREAIQKLLRAMSRDEGPGPLRT
jgi:transcriptional regulator with XRE-family HTH domain